MGESGDFRPVPADQVADCRFFSVDAKRLAAIKERLTSAPPGGIALSMPSPPPLDSLVEISFRPEKTASLLEAIGVVAWADEDTKTIGVRFLRVGSKDLSSLSRDQASQTMVGKEGAVTRIPKDETFVSVRGGAKPPAATVRVDNAGVVVTGEFDAPLYEGFNSAWLQILNRDTQRLIIDLSGVTRMSSMAVGMLVGAHMDAFKKGKAVTIRASIQFQRLFSVTKIDRVINFVYLEPDADSASAKAQGAAPQPLQAKEEPSLDALLNEPSVNAQLAAMARRSSMQPPPATPDEELAQAEEELRRALADAENQKK